MSSAVRRRPRLTSAFFLPDFLDSRIQRRSVSGWTIVTSLSNARPRKLAAAKLAQEKPGQTLRATALVHEAYIRLVDIEEAQHWNNAHRGVLSAGMKSAQPSDSAPRENHPRFWQKSS